MQNLRRLSPLWNITGFGIHHLAIDVLHTLDLGVLQRFIGTVLWRFLDAQIFVSDMVSGMLNRESLDQLGIAAIRGMTYKWYSDNPRGAWDFFFGKTPPPPPTLQQTYIPHAQYISANYGRAPPDDRKPHNEIWNLTHKMLGSRRSPDFSAKGMETRHFFPFVMSLLRRLVRQFFHFFFANMFFTKT